MADVPDPYSRTMFRGVPLDYATAAALVACEQDLGYRLTVVQGIGGAKASAGTHLEGRAADLAPFEGTRKEKVLRDNGFAAWVRPELPGVWGAHVHAILIFESRANEKGISPAGYGQIASYDQGRDGLARNGIDPHPYRPNPKVVFTVARYERIMEKIGLDGVPNETKVTKARDALVQADADMSKAIAMLRKLPNDSDARAEIDNLQRNRTRIAASLERMPKR